jgi:CarD family transcriptional regulator
MAARKKVTKKVSRTSEQTSSNRPKPKVTRGQKADTKAKSAGRAASVSKRSKSSKAGSAGAKAATGKLEPKKGAKTSKAAARSRAGQTRPVELKVGDAKSVTRGNAKGAAPAPMPIESASAAGLAGIATKSSTLGAAVPPSPSVAVSPPIPQSAAKTAKAPSPTTPNDRDPLGGEQKTMKNSSNRHGFKLSEFVVYPAHGVGQIVAMEEQEVAGFKLELFVINFVKDKMTLRVPTSKVTAVGMRKLSDPDAARRSLEILTGRARVKRTMWSRRAQEYEAKINSGDINAIAEVVRDLYRSEAQPEQSYSERQLYEAALDRMMREIAAVQKLSETEALKVIDTQLKKNQKRGTKTEPGEGEDAGIEEAA